MKTPRTRNLLLIRILTSACLVGLAIKSPLAHAILPEKDTGSLGEIRHSLLSEDKFREINGSGWVLMDGRNVEGSDLKKEGLWHKNEIPDARGVFLRSRNYDRSCSRGCSEGDLGIGEYQKDCLQTHAHRYTRRRGLVPVYDGVHLNHSGCHHSISGTRDENWCSQETVSENVRTGEETRPRSITVNTYIKINRTPVSRETEKISDTIQNVPEQLAKNPAFSRVIREMIRSELKR